MNKAFTSDRDGKCSECKAETQGKMVRWDPLAKRMYCKSCGDSLEAATDPRVLSKKIDAIGRMVLALCEKAGIPLKTEPAPKPEPKPEPKTTTDIFGSAEIAF